MDEAGFWSDKLRPYLTAQCQKAGLRFHLERVENMVADGTPDVDYCIAGVAGKIELKYSPHHPVRESTPLMPEGKRLRRSQIIWAKSRMHAGGRVFLLIGTPRESWLIDLAGMSAREMGSLGLLTSPGAREIAAWGSFHWTGPTLPLALIKERPVNGA